MSSHIDKYGLLLGGVILELLYLSFYFLSESGDEVLLFIAVNAAAFLLYSFLLYWFRKNKSESTHTNSMGWVIGFAILFRLTLLFHSPVGSDDIYRYVWDGKVAAHGINPFAFAPNDPALSALRTDVLPSRVNHPAMRTIYPPLAQSFFFVSYKLFGDSLAGLKFLLVLADLSSIIVLIRLSKLYHVNILRTVFLYAWSPLPIMYFALDGHIDALGIPFLLLSLYFISRKKNISGAVVLGLSVLAKLYPLFIAPVFFTIGKGWRKILLPLIPATMLVLGCVMYWEPTGGLVESFATFNSVFEFNGSVFAIVYKILNSNEHAHTVCAVLFLFWLLMVFALKREPLEKIFLTFLGFIILAPVVQPWYLTWLAALLALRWSTAVFVLLGLSNLINIIVYQYRSSGAWVDNGWLLLAEYLPFYFVLGWELFKGEFRATSVKPAYE